jgi:DNA-binding GntR family transcriptional regulator
VPVSVRIHELLREKIANVELPPGSPISEKEISDGYGVSRTPIREALLRLASEGLVDIFPQRGTFVSRIRLDSVRDGMVIRQALERVSVREAAKRATEGDIADLRAGLERQRANDRSSNFRGFHAEDESFHRQISMIAGHPNLWRVVRQEKIQIDRCRVLYLPMSERRGVVIEEHKSVVDAIEAHDSDAAEHAMRIHLAGVFPSVDELLAAHPDYFEPQSPNL